MPIRERLEREQARIGTKAFTAPDRKLAIVRHIVLFRYRKDVAHSQREEVRRRFTGLVRACLRNGIPYILSIEAGRRSSGERLDQDFEDAFIITFASEGDRNYYVGAPIVTDPEYFDGEHQRFKDFVAPLLDTDGILVFDYIVPEPARHRHAGGT